MGKLRAFITQLLKSTAVRLALVNLFTKWSGGLKTWVITTLVEKAFDEFVVPLINHAFRKGKLAIDKKKGEIIYGNIQRAKDENDSDSYRDNIGRV